MKELENVRLISWNNTMYPIHVEFWHSLDWSQDTMISGHYKIRDFVRDNVDNAYARRIQEQSKNIEWKD